jgi:hypothetical protein
VKKQVRGVFDEGISGFIGVISDLGRRRDLLNARLRGSNR